MDEQTVRLGNPKGSFWCPKTKFRLVKDEEKKLPQHPSRRIKEWMNSGGIVLVRKERPKEPEPLAEVPRESSRGGSEPPEVEVEAEDKVEAQVEIAPPEGEEFPSVSSSPSISDSFLPDEDILRSMKAADLRKLCKEHGIPTKRWDTVKVLVKKLLGT